MKLKLLTESDIHFNPDEALPDEDHFDDEGDFDQAWAEFVGEVEQWATDLNNNHITINDVLELAPGIAEPPEG